MPMFDILITDTDETFRCDTDRNVLAAMSALGRKGIPIGCRNGGCGICKVRVTRGAVLRKVMSRAHVSAAEEAEGIALACRIFPESDLELAVIGKMKCAMDAQEQKGRTG